MKKFKVGDKVQSREFGVGVIGMIDDSNSYCPIKVRWTKDAKYPGLYDIFTIKGRYHYDYADAEKDITLLEGEDTVEEDKVKTDAINPVHYQVAGIPEAIEIMSHLMTKEQFEGFLWGNIIKYAYRYGRRGDKKETAGKIEWYARKLKEGEYID